jgi:hypothetical protein
LWNKSTSHIDYKWITLVGIITLWNKIEISQ